MEEMRLAREADNAQISTIVQAASQAKQQAPQQMTLPEIVVSPPNVVVNVTPQQPRKRGMNVVFDEFDNARIEYDEDPITALVESVIGDK